MDRLFGTDGIRGKANHHPMDAATALKVGRAVARHFQPDSGKSHLVIGQDTRLSGDMLTHAVAAGVCSAGMDVTLLGIIPTPGVAYMTGVTKAAAGVVISASHNPYTDNGIKVFNSRGYKLSDAEEQHIEALIAEGQSASGVTSNGIGRQRPAENVTVEYMRFLEQAVPALSLQGMTIAVDCANGATYKVAPMLLERLGATVIQMACVPDGININADCGSQHPGHLSRAVVDRNADLGLAFDGDGDRLIAVDENGSILTGDQIMVICADHLSSLGKLKNNKVITTVMSNMGFHLALENLGIEAAVTSVGDRYVIEKMISEDAILGGEDSGHMIFRDVHTTGDGMMAALRLLEAMQRAGKPLSDLSKLMTVFPQRLINIDVRRKPDLHSVPEIQAVIRKAERALGTRGRVLVRYSGTQSTCRVMVEAQTQHEAESYCREIAEVIQLAIG